MYLQKLASAVVFTIQSLENDSRLNGSDPPKTECNSLRAVETHFKKPRFLGFF